MQETTETDSCASGAQPCDATEQNDLREQLYNGGEVGAIRDIQVSTERITMVRGILYDLDPKLLKESSVIPEVPKDPATFYDRAVKHWLRNDPVLAKAEVRNSGTGLHAILRLDPALSIQSDQDRKRVSGVIQAVQVALPIDPDQPWITAVTRPIGSINTKNGARVTRLATGEPVTWEEILQLYHEMKEAPFRTVLHILVGRNTTAPCPVCGKEGSSLTGLGRYGQCYGSCGKVSLARLYDALLKPRSNEAKESKNAPT